jgi:hypothetical protein
VPRDSELLGAAEERVKLLKTVAQRAMSTTTPDATYPIDLAIPISAAEN